MRIVHVRTDFDVGLGYDTFWLPKAQQDLGHEVIVVCSDLASASNRKTQNLQKEDIDYLHRKDYKIGGIPVHRLPHSVHYADFTLVQGLKQILTQLKPDVVQCMAVKEGMPTVCAKFKHELGYKLFTREDQYDFPASSRWKRVLIKIEYILFRKWWSSYFYQKANGIFSTSVEGIKFIERFHRLSENVPIKYLPVCVNLDIFKFNGSARKRIRAEQKVKKSEVIIITAGKIVPIKKYELLLDAFAKVQGSAKYWLIGGGDSNYVHQLKQQAERLNIIDRVAFIPNVKHEELADWYSAADIGTWYRTSSSVQEAMAVGLPLVIPEFFKEIVPEYEGVFVMNFDVKALTHGWQELIDDAKKRKKMSQDSIQAAHRFFDVKKQAKEYIQLYNAL